MPLHSREVAGSIFCEFALFLSFLSNELVVYPGSYSPYTYERLHLGSLHPRRKLGYKTDGWK